MLSETGIGAFKHIQSMLSETGIVCHPLPPSASPTTTLSPSNPHLISIFELMIKYFKSSALSSDEV